MKFKVDNMTCMHCEKSIRKALQSIGIKKIKISLEEKEVTIVLKKVTKDKVEEVIKSIGYHFQEI